MALDEEFTSANGSAVQRLYNKMSVDPWIVFWATRKPDSLGSSGSNFDGPPSDLAQIRQWPYFQSRVDPSTRLRRRFFTGPP
eukprot:3473927-Pyramimonas_sp.AAC.1